MRSSVLEKKTTAVGSSTVAPRDVRVLVPKTRGQITYSRQDFADTIESRWSLS